MRYATVCSGIEAPSVAWHPLGWEPAWFSEIEPFPCDVLASRWPNVPNLGDMTKITDEEIARHGPIDLLCGGTPCQSFSVAGLRKGLADPRGNLALVFLALLGRMRPRWVVWENVPGVLSSDGGRTFGAFLGALGELGYGFAYRVLDAQFFGVAQQRERVFIVGRLGDWRGPAAVLSESSCLRGDPPPSRKARQDAAFAVRASASRCMWDVADNLVAAPLSAGNGANGSDAGRRREDDVNLVARCVTARQTWLDAETETFVTMEDPGIYCDVHDARHDAPPCCDIPNCDCGGAVRLKAYQCQGTNVGEMGTLRAGNGNETGGVPFVFNWQSGGDVRHQVSEDHSSALSRCQTPAVAFDTTQITSKANRSCPQAGDPCHPLAAGAHAPAIAYPIQEVGKRESKDQNGVGIRIAKEGSPMYTLQAGAEHGVAIVAPTLTAYNLDSRSPQSEESQRIVAAVQEAQTGVREYDLAGALRANGPGHDPVGTRIREGSLVRRLTPRECERLQGFPDDYTLILRRKGLAKDAPRYKALGNSMAVPVVRWLGQRIAAVDELLSPPPPVAIPRAKGGSE